MGNIHTVGPNEALIVSGKNQTIDSRKQTCQNWFKLVNN